MINIHKYKRKKYLYWIAENEDHYIMIRDFNHKEAIRNEFPRIRFKKIKSNKKPYWFDDTNYGYVIDKNEFKSRFNKNIKIPAYNKSTDEWKLNYGVKIVNKRNIIFNHSTA